MLEALKLIWRFAGKERGNLNKSLALGVVYALFHIVQITAIYLILQALTAGQATKEAAFISLGLLVLSVAGRAVANYFSQLQRVHAGYFMVAEKRIAIGDKLKAVPMGYFNESSSGELTGVATTVLNDVENTAPRLLVTLLSGFLNTLILLPMLLFWQWRIGALFLLGVLSYLLVTASMEKKSRSLAPKRQKAQAKLVEAVLEQIQGMPVIKAFNLRGKGDARVREALDESRAANLNIEKLFTPYSMAQEMTLRFFSVAIMLAALFSHAAGTLDLLTALMGLVLSFLVFSEIESTGSMLMILRVVTSSIEQAQQTTALPQLDLAGRAIEPAHHDVSFEHVDFFYGTRKILDDVSIVFPERSLTAIVGPNGSGKTTLCHLIARFWDVARGSIKIGGHDVRDYTLESLMRQVSIVFQRVYLFRDTVENNIRFGKPTATREEVVAAAREACCHDFIETLPEGYDTLIGDGGASLSGGERQRISIARAILKDAPIIIFDEATANVDPENEDRLQKAMESLTKGKTVIMIAHRLNTVRNAHQILVLDEGRIVQRGTHEELLHESGIYADFIRARETALGWKAVREKNGG